MNRILGRRVMLVLHPNAFDIWLHKSYILYPSKKLECVRVDFWLVMDRAMNIVILYHSRTCTTFVTRW